MRNLLKCLIIFLMMSISAASAVAQQKAKRINYFLTNYVTNGSGGWVNGGQSAGQAESYSVSDTKIIDGDGMSYSYDGQITMFNITVNVYVADNNNQMFILRSGNELMYALTNNGLFLAEMQQVGVANQRLSRHNISGWYNSSTVFSNPSTTSPRQQQTRTTCTYCNGWGKVFSSFNNQYSGTTPPERWCEICGKYLWPHSHQTCPSCGGSGYK